MVQIYTPSNDIILDNKLELLSPAKNADYGIEAIRHGADAVYIGGPAFGARATAGNSVSDIARLSEFAHGYGAQVFVALNTIMSDAELAQADTLIHELYDAGVDALIVQDMGVLQLDLPPIALHASTQTDNRTPEKVAFMEQVGFSQVVLARELSLQQIADIAATVKTRLEFFIHGALCVSYSGLCNLSHAFSKRSANRGECSQMCRLPCNLKTRDGEQLAENQHLLSLKDNNQTDNLDALINAGIRSFKIEGRLKDLSYVKNVTAHYRQQLDKILDRNPSLQAASHGRCEYTFVPNPDKSFNRGKTDYFVNQRHGGLNDFRTPKYLGQSAGKVTAIGKDWLEIDHSGSEVEQLHNGDGLCYFTIDFQKAIHSDAKLSGLRVNRADGNRAYLANQVPSDLRVGMELFRNLDHDFEAVLSKESSKRLINVDITLFDTDSGLGVRVKDDHGHQIEVSAALEKQAANDADKTIAQQQKGLAKLGGTRYHARKVEIATSQPWFVPAGQLNALRREAIDAFEQYRVDNYQRPPQWPRSDAATFPQKHLNFLGNVLNDKAESFYKQHGVIEIDAAYEKNQVLNDAPLMITKHCLRYSFNLCPKETPGIKAEPMVLEVGSDTLKLVFDCQKCEMMVVGSNRL
ncbi:U32 family peptidase [Shewanella sp. A3A]|uniref:U32 family peptidase n=1 Tax=Shewanella electrica TaxID=515560 RepID=A0ABT2FHH7_9GAMM|nr:U32 family peptidase [Shewanella electrica]MCH1921271.1 U32 family peptidase [Shewanella ferrihydritica]MCH1923890.1 U32 family peptidase [Shewanella electrica]MCS4555794.1 U32 family peptidase [Shewanella electrica]